MLSFAIIVFREVLEVVLVLGVLLVATRGMLHRGRWVGVGLVAGGIGAGIIAIFADRISAGKGSLAT